MGNINSKINLTALISQVKEVAGKGGNMVRCIIIPIEANHLFEGEKGIYLDTIGFEHRSQGSKDTHLIKQSLPKKVRDGMTKAELEKFPILGNHIVWEDDNDTTKAAASSTAKSKTKSKADEDEPPF